MKRKPSNAPKQKKPWPAWAWRYMLACLDQDVKQTITARCKEAGVSRKTLYEYLRREDFVTWMQDQLSKALMDENREVRLALLKQCTTGNLEAIKLWHELYGQYIPTQRIVSEQRDVSELSNADLAEVARILAGASPAGTGSKVH